MSGQERNTQWLTPSDNRLRHFWEVQNLSQRTIEEEMCQTSVFGGQTQKLPLVSEEQVPLKLVAGTMYNRRWWKLSCEVPVQGNMFYSLCPWTLDDRLASLWAQWLSLSLSGPEGSGRIPTHIQCSPTSRISCVGSHEWVELVGSIMVWNCVLKFHLGQD